MRFFLEGMIIEYCWVVLFLLHIALPLAYICYMRYVALKRPWNVRRDPNYEPELSIIIPTYNEASTIEKKLKSIMEADYPRSKMELIIVDGASTDGTSELARKWVADNSEIRVKVLVEDRRLGMVHAENLGLKHASHDIVVKTDSDCFWLNDSLRKAIQYLADPAVGAVAALHITASFKDTATTAVEKIYRDLYRWSRIGESKMYSTVLFEGEFMIFRKKLLEGIGGFNEEIGADDIQLALNLVRMGYRALSVDDAFFVEYAPYSWRERFRQKVRRGRHVLESLVTYFSRVDGPPVFKRFILPMEIYIYLVNPLLFIPFVLVSIMLIIKYPFVLVIGSLLLLPFTRRLVFAYLSNMSIVMVAVFKELIGRESTAWTKIKEIREGQGRR